MKIHPMLHDVLNECKDGDLYSICISGEDDITCNIEMTVNEAAIFNEVLRRASLSEKYTGKYTPELSFGNESACRRVAEKERQRLYEEKKAEARKKHEQDVRENGAIAMAFKKAGLTKLFEEG